MPKDYGKMKGEKMKGAYEKGKKCDMVPGAEYARKGGDPFKGKPGSPKGKV